MKKRLLGIETEYGITIDTNREIDPVTESIQLIKSYRQDDFRPIWDYSCEDPFHDERGFRAETLLEHPDEKELQKKDRQRKESFVEIKSDRILTNGARLYNDHAHPEYSTPECYSVFDLIAHDKAGEQILRQCAKRRSEKIGKTVLLYKNNTDYKGHSYGCHDNYLMRREIEFEYLATCLLPFLITRQIFAGAGKLGIESEEGMIANGCYQISQRSDFFQVIASIDTMHKRPIINTRDEPHADPKKYRRLHGIVGDANMSEFATALKIGTTALVIDLIEQKMISPENFAIADPIHSIKEVSRDLEFERNILLQNGKTISAIDLQREFLDLARKIDEPSIDEADWIIAEWESTLDQLEADPMELTDRIDWVAKKFLLEMFVEEEQIAWDDPWLQSIALEYHNIDPDQGLYYALLDQGSIRRVVTDRQIDHAIHNPPSDTRAYFRGRSIEKFSREIKSIQWDHVTFNVNGRSVQLSMNDLAEPEIAKKYNSILDHAETVSDLIRSLK